MNTITQPALREFAFTQSDFQFLAKLANSKTGIVLAEQKKDMIYGRLARRLRALGLESFSEYCALMQSEAGADEIGELVNAITTNLTSFFREGHHFTHLRDEMLPSIKDKKLRIWSSACSSGMEPYSIAMTLRAATPALCKKYVERSGKPNRACMSDDLKKLIAFRQLNLLETWPMKGQFDAVFCRNVVIYFDKPTKQKLFARMAEAIKPNGWLYIGHSENLHGISDRFELVGRTIYRRIK
jgi:chemotaxis protein methyltransferase CheR